MKPRLPPCVESRFPQDVLAHLYQFVPRNKPKSPKWPNGTQREVEKLQKSPKRTPMDLKGLDDFVLC